MEEKAEAEAESPDPRRENPAEKFPEEERKEEAPERNEAASSSTSS